VDEKVRSPIDNEGGDVTTAPSEAIRFETARPAWTKLLPPLAGLALVAGLIVSVNSPAVEDAGDTPAEIVATASDHSTWVNLVLAFALIAVALAGGFVAGLHTRLREIATPLESTLVLVGGIVFTICFPLALFMFQAPLVDMPDDHARALVEAEAYLTYDDAAWVAFAAAGLGAALMAIPASLAAMRGGLPSWLGWLGVLAGVVSLGTIFFFGMFAWTAWILVASIVMLVAREV
jgi:hypothetical protein